MLKPVYSNRFKRDVKLAIKRGKNLEKMATALRFSVPKDHFPLSTATTLLAGIMPNSEIAILNQTGY